jgi:hypothetical protein
LNGFTKLPLKTKAPKISADACMVQLLAYLKEIKVKHCKPSYKPDYLVSGVFQKSASLGNDAEVMAYCRCRRSARKIDGTDAAEQRDDYESCTQGPLGRAARLPV